MRFRHGEGVAEALVEAQRQVSGDLEVLALVVTDGHAGGVVDEDVRGHEDGIGEEPDVGVVPLGRLVLELRHPGGLAEGRLAGEDPHELGVLTDVALAEDRRALRVHSPGDELRGGHPGTPGDGLRVGRHREGVEVGDEVVRVEVLLQPDPVDERPEVVAEVQGVARGLHPGEDAGLVGCRTGHARIVSARDGRQYAPFWLRTAASVRQRIMKSCTTDQFST